MMKVGIRAHDMGNYNLENFSSLLKKITSLDGQCMQLALGKSFIDFKVSKENLNTDLAGFLKNNLTEEKVRLSVLGCYINMGNPDKEKRYADIEKFKYHLDFSKNFDNCLVGTETGCLTTDYTYTPLNDSEEAFNTFLDTLKEIVSYAEKTGTFVGIEGVKKDIICTPEKMDLALKAVPSKNLKVIFDPTNYLDITNFQNQKEIIEKAFELFSDKIEIIHLKDFSVEDNRLKVVPIGHGNFDIKTLLACIKKYNVDADILLENSTPETAKECIKFINESNI